MNNIDFTKNGGLPATQYLLKFMMESYASAFVAMANLIGDKVIVYGVDEVGGVVTNGFVVINGELLPFIGGPLVDRATATVIIQETKESRLFDDGGTKDVYFTRVARFGSPGGFLYTDLKKIGTIADHVNNKQNPHEVTLAQLGFTASDDPSQNNSTKLATTKLTNQLAGLNKIAGSGVFNVGDVPGGDPEYTVTHNLNIVGLYIVHGSIMSNNSATYYLNNKVSWTWYAPLANSFKFSLQELSGEVQDLSFAWTIIKL
jgi:hypothetical protein